MIKLKVSDWVTNKEVWGVGVKVPVGGVEVGFEANAIICFPAVIDQAGLVPTLV